MFLLYFLCFHILIHKITVEHLNSKEMYTLFISDVLIQIFFFVIQFDQYMLINQRYYLTVMVFFVFVNFIIFFVDVSGRILNWSFYGIVAEEVGQL